MPSFDDLKTTRMPNGVTNAAPWQTMGGSGVPDPSWAHTYHNDFDTYLASDWLIADTGTMTRGLLAGGDGGQLSIATDTVANDGTYMQLSKAGFVMGASGGNMRQLFFKIRANLSDAVNSTFWAGMVAPTGTPATPSDGFYINKASGSALLTLNSVVGGVSKGSVSLGSLNTLSNNTFFELGIMLDYQGNLAAFFNPTTGKNTPISAANAASGSSRGRVAALYNTGSSLTSLISTAALSPAFWFTTTAAAAKTLLVDYITAVHER